MEYISYNTGKSALLDIYALALGRCVPSGVMHIYQEKHSCLCYNFYIYTHTDLRSKQFTNICFVCITIHNNISHLKLKDSNFLVMF